jgi:hypothetical protein
MTVPDHDDVLADAVAMVEAAGWREDAEGFGAVVRNMDAGRTAVILAKLLAELLADNGDGYGVCPECFRAWSASAIERS